MFKDIVASCCFVILNCHNLEWTNASIARHFASLTKLETKITLKRFLALFYLKTSVKWMWLNCCVLLIILAQLRKARLIELGKTNVYVEL